MKNSNRPTRSFRDKPRFASADGGFKGKSRFGKSNERNDRFDNQKPKRFYSEKPRSDKSAAASNRGEGHVKKSFPEKSRNGRPNRDDARDIKPMGRDRRGQNPIFKPRAAPAQPTFQPHDQDSVLVWGLHAVRAAWLNPKRRCYRLWISESSSANFEPIKTEARDTLLLKRPDPKKVERQELDRMTPPGSVHQGIVLEMAPLPEPSLHDLISGDHPPELLIMLDQVTDPHNVGAILRSAAAFGAGAVIMTERNAPTTTGVLAKSASGALEHVPMIHVVNLSRALDDLKQAGYWSVGLAEEGERDLGALDLTGRTVVVLGAEGDGLRQLTRKKCDELSRLPTGGEIGSLNVSNAAAVALYEVRRQKKAIG